MRPSFFLGIGQNGDGPEQGPYLRFKAPKILGIIYVSDHSVDSATEASQQYNQGEPDKMEQHPLGQRQILWTAHEALPFFYPSFPFF